jgi:hypothetical protein
MSDFYEAYLGENYTGIAQFGTSSLHNSCMKCEDKARNAADFYVNFAGAKIIIAKDAEKNILGRAIVWEKVEYVEDDFDFDIKLIISVLDRIYFSHDFIIKIIRDYAKKIGIVLRKKHNDHKSTDSFVSMTSMPKYNIKDNNDFFTEKLQIKVPASQWHKKGAPFLDTFHSVCLYKNGTIYLRNSEDDDCFAVCRDTGGYAQEKHGICPLCGILYNSYDSMCSCCTDKHRVETVFGTLFSGKTIKYEGKIYPDFLFYRGKPKPNLKRYLQIKKLYKK